MKVPVDAALVDAVAGELLAVADAHALVEPLSARYEGFDAATAAAVIDAIAARRRADGWTPVGRKIGFTNRTIWELYGVDGPMWAHVWDRTLQQGGAAQTIAGDRFVQGRIEPEIVFRLAGPPPTADDPVAILEQVEWIAPGFEIVQCHFPDWRFSLADCTADFGLHGALVVGPPTPVDALGREALATTLASFELTLCRDGAAVDRGVGANVLGSPALALAHLARVVAARPASDPVLAGEIITTGTLTDAWPLAPGQTWTHDSGTLGLGRLELTVE